MNNIKFKVGDKVKANNTARYSITSVGNGFEGEVIKVRSCVIEVKVTKSNDNDYMGHEFTVQPEHFDLVTGSNLTKEEALGKIEELKAFISQEDKVEVDDTILVPEYISIEEDIGRGDGLGLVFDDDEKVMFYKHGHAAIQDAQPRDFIKCKLVKVDEDDLEEGSTYFHTDDDKPDFGKKVCYCKYLDEGVYSYNSSEGLEISNCDWVQWYQVVKVD